MADKDFKVKTGLDLPAPLPLSEGGTGQTSAENTRNALMPVQTGHSGKFITTDGTGMSWAVAPQQTATDGAAGYKVYAGNTTPTGQSTGDIWIDASTGNGIQLVRWRKTIASSGSTITGLDDNNLTLSYTAGNEQVYINGTLITRGQDYTATNGTSISLTQALEVGDTVEIFGNPLFSVTDTYTQAQSNSLYTSKLDFYAAGKNKIINSDFSINQYGFTSITGIAGGILLDRWQGIAYQGGGTYTYSLQSFAPSEITTNSPIPAKKFMRITTSGTTTQDNRVILAQKIEGVDSYAGQTVTVSFWAKALSGSPYIAVNALQVFGTGGSSAVNVPLGKIQISTNWSRYSITGTIQSIVNKTIGPNDHLRLEMYVSAGTDWATQSSSLGFQNNTFDIWGVQIESGAQATGYLTSTGTIYGELAACQRYFVRYEKTGGNQTYFLSGQSISTTRAFISLPLPVNMRTSPSISRSAGVSIYNMGSNFNITTLNLYQSTQNILNLDGYVSSGLTNNTPVMISLTANGDYLDFSAEL